MELLQLITKTNGIVSSYNDAAIFHICKGGDKKGCLTKNRYESLTKYDEEALKPYGILASKYSNPFSLRFDSKVAFIEPGILDVFGRQVELTEEVTVHDFSLENSKLYCTVYIQISTEDMTNERALIGIFLDGGSFRNFPNDVTADNLYKLQHGNYQAPLARFIYDPNFSTYFYSSSIIMNVFNIGRKAAKNLDETTTIDKTYLLKNIRDTTSYYSSGSSFVFNKCKNADSFTEFDARAKANYSSGSNDNTNLSGYSRALVSKKFGGVEIFSDLSNIITSNRNILIYIGNNFGQKGSSTDISFKCDWEHLRCIRLFFKNAWIKAKLPYEEHTVASFGAISYLGNNNNNGEIWALASDTTKNILEQDFVFESDRIANINKVKLGCYLKGDYETVTSGSATLKMNEIYSSSFDSGNDGFLQIAGIKLASYQASSHIFATITIEKDANNSQLAHLIIKGIGNTQEYTQYLSGLDWAWWKYKDLEDESANGQIGVDCIYSGDVSLT